MRYSIDIDDNIIKKIDQESKEQHRSRKLQMETIIITHFEQPSIKSNAKDLKSTHDRITKNKDAKELLKKL